MHYFYIVITNQQKVLSALELLLYKPGDIGFSLWSTSNYGHVTFKQLISEHNSFLGKDVHLIEEAIL